VNSPLKLTGISLNSPHYLEILEKRPALAWVEFDIDNYLLGGGPHLLNLEKIRQLYPISLHSKSLSLGSTDELNWRYLKKLNNLITKVKPALISDHLAWSSFQGRHFHEFFPLPFTEEALSHVAHRIDQVQNYLQRQILIENIPAYYSFPDSTDSNNSTMTEWEFIKQVAQTAHCGILLNINHLEISARYQNFDPYFYLMQIPTALIQEIHLIGSLAQSTWDLYQQAILLLGIKPTIVECDPKLTSTRLDDLCSFALLTENIMRETYAARKLTG
jgi:uncharacterized protein (UPF0276 family)